MAGGTGSAYVAFDVACAWLAIGFVAIGLVAAALVEAEHPLIGAG